jgi:hypothetical protein
MPAQEVDLVTVHRSDLWRGTSRIGALESVLQALMESVQHLEAATGRTWYSRGTVG